MIDRSNRTCGIQQVANTYPVGQQSGTASPRVQFSHGDSCIIDISETGILRREVVTQSGLFEECMEYHEASMSADPSSLTGGNIERILIMYSLFIERLPDEEKVAATECLREFFDNKFLPNVSEFNVYSGSYKVAEKADEVQRYELSACVSARTLEALFSSEQLSISEKAIMVKVFVDDLSSDNRLTNDDIRAISSFFLPFYLLHAKYVVRHLVESTIVRDAMKSLIHQPDLFLEDPGPIEALIIQSQEADLAGQLHDTHPAPRSGSWMSVMKEGSTLSDEVLESILRIFTSALAGDDSVSYLVGEFPLGWIAGPDNYRRAPDAINCILEMLISKDYNSWRFADVVLPLVNEGLLDDEMCDVVYSFFDSKRGGYKRDYCKVRPAIDRLRARRIERAMKEALVARAFQFNRYFVAIVMALMALAWIVFQQGWVGLSCNGARVPR